MFYDYRFIANKQLFCFLKDENYLVCNKAFRIKYASFEQSFYVLFS